MENKADVKTIMARFQANASTSEEAPSAFAGRPKQPLHPTTSGPSSHMNKPMREGPPGGGASVPPKPSFLKNSPNSDAVAQEASKTKALAGVFENPQDEMNKPFLKHKAPSKPSFTPASEAKTQPNRAGISATGSDPKPKPSFTPVSEAKVQLNRAGISATGSDPKPKPSFTPVSEAKMQLNRAGLSATGSDPKPAFPKPALTSTKPSWVTEDSTPSASSSGPKVPPVQLKPNNSFFKLQQQVEAKTEANAGSGNKPSLPVNTAVKPSNFRTTQNLFNKDPPEQPDSATNSTPPPKPAASKKPSLKKPSPHVNEDSPSTPKKNPLPNSLALGPAPAKPNRPPNVSLDSFKNESRTRAEGPAVPPHPSSHPGNHSNSVPAAPAPAPSLPPRHPGAINQTEELYDDVDGLSSAPPPLPPVHPSQLSKGKDGSDDDDGEMYEDLDDRWEAAEQKQEKKDKEDKKRLEAERKEQREREKKEQEARKKFKLDGPIEVLQKGKACVDCKGSKTDLSLKQGDSLDIIRILGNPEGKWLGRAQDGSVGYVKIGSVKIDYNSLKQQAAEQAYESEVYDDIDTTPAEQSKTKRGKVVPPPDPGEEIYDDVDSNIDASSSETRLSSMKPRVLQWMLERGRRAPSNDVLPPLSQSSGETDQNEEIYDDVDSESLPNPSSMISKADPKKMKKLEKEEKEFRKKFKYEGEIKVLHQVTIIPNLTNKKWSSKELPLKAGEKLDVIVPAADNKFICRNEDGKFGYVSTSYVVTDDSDIYDDIGDDSIYDND